MYIVDMLDCTHVANLVVEIGGALEFDEWVAGSTETLISGGEEIYDLGGDSSLAMERTIAPSLLVFKYFISTSLNNLAWQGQLQLMVVDV